MVSIQVSKGQGLTQAFKSYAQQQGYDVSKITNKNWADTINEFKDIQTRRNSNNQPAIYSGSNMTIHEGNINFSEGEIQNIFVAMGLETKGSAFNNWTVSVSNDPEAKNNDFVIAKEVKDDEANLIGFVDTTRSYIKEYDTDGDGAISFDELYAKEVKIAEDNDAIAPDKETVKLLFDRLDVKKDGISKNVLTEKEIFNYFYAMDRLNVNNIDEVPDEVKADGVITQAEYMTMAISLADKSTKKGNNGEFIATFLRNTYNQLFPPKNNN
jgi:hypothetical protein